jgi:hypothetical protein
MFGLIQDRPLLVSDTLAHAALYHAETPIVSPMNRPRIAGGYFV